MLSLDISPVILKIGFIQVTYYSLVYVLGFLVSLFVLLRASRKKAVEINEEQVYDIIFLSALGLIIGARLFHIVFWDLEYFSNNLGEIPKIWLGGLSFHGGLLGLVLSMYIYTKIKKINLLRLADILVLPAIFFLALGRIANFINQEIVGTATNFKFCYLFQGYSECRHAVQLYASLGRFILFGFLLYTKKKLGEFKEGFLFLLFLVLISIGRFSLDFFREGDKYYGLLTGQWLSIVVFMTAMFVLLRYYRGDVNMFILH